MSVNPCSRDICLFKFAYRSDNGAPKTLVDRIDAIDIQKYVHSLVGS
jgi:hypothetical protein